jgi:hypothetical protein
MSTWLSVSWQRAYAAEITDLNLLWKSVTLCAGRQVKESIVIDGETSVPVAVNL